MAIFRQQRVNNVPFGIYEVPGKLYIEGQAHDVTTLAPIFNDTISLSSYASRTALPLVPQRARSYVVQAANYASTCNNATLLDCNQGILQSNKMSSVKPDVLFIPPTRLSSSNTGGAINSKTNTSITVWQDITNSWQGSSYIFHESNTSLLCMNHNASQNPHNGSSSLRLASATKTDNTTLATSFVIEHTASSSGHVVLSLVGESDNDFYFFQEGSSTSSYMSSSTPSFYSVSKPGTLTSKTLPGQRNGGSYNPAYRPTKAVTVNGTQKAFWVPNALNAGTAAGDAFNFIVVEFDTSLGATSATNTLVAATGTGIGIQPGMSVNSNFLEYISWTFEANGFNYICVGAASKTNNVVNNNLDTNYIHVFKSPIGSPRVISYVSSTLMSASTKAHGIMPIDSNWKNLVVPYTNQGLDFLTWSQGTESYIKTNTVAMDPVFMMVDQVGRLWVSEAGTEGRLHLFSPTISATVRVGFQDSTLRYTGTELSSNLMISTFNFEGARIANNVTLQIDSMSATFDDGTTTKTITTSTTGDLFVPFKIKGAGYIRVLANLAI
jgi:hypothetical protein